MANISRQVYVTGYEAPRVVVETNDTEGLEAERDLGEGDEELEEEEPLPVDYSFERGEDVSMGFDLTSYSQKQRDVFDLAFKKPSYDSITVFVEGQENNSAFAINLSYIELDRFDVSIKSNTTIPSDVYCMLVSGKNEYMIVKKRIVFNWGLEDHDAIRSRVAKIKERGPLLEIINLTKKLIAVNDTIDVVDNASVVNESVVNESVVNESVVNESVVNESVLNGTSVNGTFVNTSVSEERGDTEQFSLTTDKEAYNLSSKIRISFMGNLTDLYVQHNGRKFGFSSQMIRSGEIIFTPQTPGEYSIKAECCKEYPAGTIERKVTVMDISDTGLDVQNLTPTNVSETTTISDNITLSEEDLNKTILDDTSVEDGNTSSVNLINQTLNLTGEGTDIEEGAVSLRPVIRLKDRKSRDINAEIRFYYPNGSIRVIENKRMLGLIRMILDTINPEDPIEIGQYDIEIRSTEKWIEKITLNNFSYDGDLSVEYDDIDPLSVDIGGRDIKRSFAINLEGADFLDGEMRVSARGTELYKCQAWNFEEGLCTGRWVKVKNIVPGQDYSIEIFPGDPGYAEVGVATINTKKPVYYPNEAAEIVMVVLDNQGHLVKGADVRLSVMDPLNGTEVFGTRTGEILEIQRGVYSTTFYQTVYEGNYTLQMDALGNRVDSTILSYFSVDADYPFDIIREVPVTIDPWKKNLISSIRIESLNGVGGFDFTEVLPDGFEVVDDGGADVSIVDGEKRLVWEDVSSGSVVSYEAKVPLVTPELYALGPSFVEYADPVSGGQEIYEEARSWMLAVDPLTWWNQSWESRINLTFNNSGRNENLVDFPVLVKLTDSRFEYENALSLGSDIRFVDSDESTELAYHFESWTYNGDSYIWVRVPQIDANS
ncbi:MAG: DUF2341 domain-containing protein, partial [Candidatus Thorarchaeota archaeon]